MILDSALVTLVSQLLCVAAVYVGSDRALKLYIALSSVRDGDVSGPGLAASQLSNHNDAEAGTGIVETTRMPWWRRALTKRVLKTYLTFIIIIGVEFLVVFGMPRWTTQVVQDTFWTAFTGTAICSSIYGSMYLIFRPISTIHLESTPKNVKMVVSPHPDYPLPLFMRPRARFALSAIMTTAILSCAYSGVYSVLPVIASAYILNIVAVIHFPKIQIRRIVQLFLGTLIVGTVLAGSAVMVGRYFDKNKSGEESGNNSDEDIVVTVYFSEWIGQVMAMFNFAIGFIFPGVLLAMTLRFEHDASAVAQLHPEPKEGRGIVPTVVPIFPKPIFTAGIVTVLLGIVSLHVALVNQAVIRDPAGIEVLGLHAITLATMSVMALSAWYCGNFTSWWSYSENWFPAKSQATSEPAAAIGDAHLEKGLRVEVAHDLVDVKL